MTHIDRIVALDDEHKRASRTLLRSGGRDGDGIAAGVHQQSHIDELIGKQGFVVIVEAGFQAQRARRHVDLVVQRFKLPRRNSAGMGAVIGFDLQARTGSHLLEHLGQLGFWQGKRHGYWLSLRNNDQPFGIARADKIAPIDFTQSQSTTDGRGDPCVVELQARILDSGAVGLLSAFVLLHQRSLGI